jgi:hypothetical protein
MSCVKSGLQYGNATLLYFLYSFHQYPAASFRHNLILQPLVCFTTTSSDFQKGGVLSCGDWQTDQAAIKTRNLNKAGSPEAQVDNNLGHPNQ